MRGGSSYNSVDFSTPQAISGWTVDGWRTDNTATSAEYLTGIQSYTGTTVSFYAVYSRTITLTFASGGGAGTAPSNKTDTQYYNSAGNVSTCGFMMPANPFYRIGYRFNKWGYGTITISEYGLFLVNSGVNETSTFPFVAQWTPVVYVKQSGTWRETVPQIKVSGTWKTPHTAYIKVDGTWKQLY